jgi:2-polyprenyl-3-methyl-5-hydroxy-6-metoxy-1,4-benzoquinol methylase
MAQQRKVKGWFTTEGRPGDRTLAQQLTGLDDLRARVKDKTILDVGCAEGLISMQLFDDGAAAVHGLEIVPGHVEVANKLRGARACTFEVADANTYEPVRQYDIVIMLALLQKLRDPSAACKRLIAASRHMVVLRLPPATAPTVIDARSGGQPHHIGAVMTSNGFMLKASNRGHLNEWVGTYERIAP